MVETVRFPDIPLYRGWGAPMRTECDLVDLEVVEGEVPADLNGTLYRVGPDRQYPPMTGEDVFIDGEGMAHMVRFKNGHVDYKCRWIRNERFLLQEEARRSLYGRYRNRYTDDPSVAGKSRNTSNTNAVWHGRKLLILKEDSLPVEVDPDTMETIGEWDCNGAVKAVSLTAHPKLDLNTNELLMFSYQARGDGTTDIAFYIFDVDGKVAHEVWFHMPYPGMVHDFAATDSHIIFPFWPLITDMDVVKQGGPYYRWHPEQETVVAVLPRRGKAEDIRWFRGPAMSAGHMMNAVTDGSKVHLDVCLYKGNCFDFFPTYDDTPYVPCAPQLSRMTFDLDRNDEGIETKLLLGSPGEMPTCDTRYMGKPYRYGYMICRSPTSRSGDMSLGAIGRYDHQTGELKTWEAGENSGVQEPLFVPRHQGAPEGDGWLLAPVNRVAENRSDIAVLDATKPEAGPVALIKLPVRIRSTFHGMWVPEDALQTGRYDV